MHDRLVAWRDRAHVLAGMPVQAADGSSRRKLIDLMRREAERQPERDPVSVRLRSLPGRPVHLRPGTSDATMLADDVVLGYHLPPRERRSHDMRSIWELGANIGIGVLGLALRYPHAEVVGVEPDPANLEVARRNLAGLEDRCRLVEGAIWDQDGEVVVEGEEEYGLTVRDRRRDDPPGVPAMRLETLLAQQGDRDVDYMLMEIEGSEQRVLQDAGWAERVKTIKVALRPDLGYSALECAADLGRLGFRTRIDAMWWGGFVIGLR